MVGGEKNNLRRARWRDILRDNLFPSRVRK
jgi:hypothetical protein